jgi:hypothetical protein
VGETRQADGFAFTIDEEYAEGVAAYVDFVLGLRTLGYNIWLERRVSPQAIWQDLEPLNIDLFGTSDCIAYEPAGKHIVIGDLKFGRGVAVSANNNPQLRYYAIGAVNFLVESGLIKLDDAAVKITMTVVQPRAVHPEGPVRSETIALPELVAWARLNLYQGIKRALSDNGKTLCAGSWCKFCPALARCSTHSKLSLDVARKMFADAPLENVKEPDAQAVAKMSSDLSADDLAELLDRIEIITPWLAAVKDLALNRLERGQSVPRWKAVPKRASRRWADDDDKILAELDGSAQIAVGQYSTRKLMTPAQVERAIGAKFYQQLIAPLVSKTSSGLTLVSEDDPRTRGRAGRSAQEAFTTIPANNT